MRRALALIAAIVLFACHRAPKAESDSAARTASTDPAVVDSLIGWAATDFHAQRASRPVRFRAVRSGWVPVPGGGRQYRLCGEYSPSSQGDAQWIPFATIKTAPYEQWVGGNALTYCNDAALMRDAEDLSARLLRHFDSLR